MSQIVQTFRTKYQSSRNFILYGLIGISAAGLDSLSFVGFRQLGIGLLIANLISMHLGMLFSFVFNTFVNFRKTDDLAKRATTFFSIAYAGMLLATGLLALQTQLLSIADLPAKLVTVMIVALVQYNLNRTITYKSGG
ncbi:MAG TPA: GtrA family protein [Candidatus Wirthbacteria bacterium]|nr:GtrA family protein [Candidatus Wirthbacteria bacterium]